MLRPLSWLFLLTITLPMVGFGCANPSTPRTGIAHVDLQSSDPHVVLTATEVVTRTEDVTAVPYLIKNLRAKDRSVRMFSIIALSKITDGQTFGYLFYSERKIREVAVREWERWYGALDQNDPQSFKRGPPPPVAGANDDRYMALQSKDVGIVTRASQNLGRARDVGAIPHLIPNLRHEDSNVRFFSITALSQITGGQTLGYHFSADEAVREPAVKRWESWNETLQATLELRKGQQQQD